MDILRETLAFDDPFSDMVETVESESREDDTFERILTKLEIPPQLSARIYSFPSGHEGTPQKRGCENLAGGRSFWAENSA
jgi:hypothetical protein